MALTSAERQKKYRLTAKIKKLNNSWNKNSKMSYYEWKDLGKKLIEAHVELQLLNDKKGETK